ncbi:peptidase [Leptospira perolatii]|uniref:Peptidase n=1 Tax=Leptospira perolatii TaxID=2023191 RepID=A0A2M9ZLP9_9LEPT|nr:peptidase [Leptospira perolatii]PJZ72921.1 peptidase [Leptospira perolatii]
MIWLGGFLASLSLGSFYSTLSYRILKFFYGKERKKYSRTTRMFKILVEPSACESCGQKITGIAILPAIGYWLSGKVCKNCGAKINPLYAFCEAAFGFLFAVAYVLSGNFLASIVFVLLCGHLLIASTTDAVKFSLDYENLPFILFFGLLLSYLLDSSLPEKSNWIVLGGFLFGFFALHFLFPNGMGFADAVFAPSFAFLLGHPWWIVFLNSSYALALAITVGTRNKGESLRGKPIPMGVYFSIGLALTFLAKIAFKNELLPSIELPSIWNLEEGKE